MDRVDFELVEGGLACSWPKFKRVHQELRRIDQKILAAELERVGIRSVQEIAPPGARANVPCLDRDCGIARSPPQRNHFRISKDSENPLARGIEGSGHHDLAV